MGPKMATIQKPFEQNTQYGQVPETRFSQALEAWQPEIDPGLAYGFARRRADLERVARNPLGAYSTPEMREQLQRSDTGELGQQEAQAMRAGQYDVNQQEMNKRLALAHLNAPVPMKQWGYQSEAYQKPSVLGSILGAAGQIGAGLAMGGI